MLVRACMTGERRRESVRQSADGVGEIEVGAEVDPMAQIPGSTGVLGGQKSGFDIQLDPLLIIVF